MDLYHALGAGIWQACAVMGAEPKSAIDFGSSIGALLSVLPVERRRGLDYSPHSVANKMIDDLVICDLDDKAQITKALNHDKFDLIICQEVAEHLEKIRPESAPGLDMPLTDGLRHAAHDDSILVFAAARPGQPGKGHISCRTARFWICTLELNGWSYMHVPSMIFAAHFCRTQPAVARNRHVNCYLNTMIFKRRVNT
jgi:hypothetical protein